MSRHHRAIKHNTATRRLRPEIEAMLPLPCVEGCGRLVEKGQDWHVAHLTPASRGGRTARDNVGPAHARCNQRAGGRLGAAVVNARRARHSRMIGGIRPW